MVSFQWDPMGYSWFHRDMDHGYDSNFQWIWFNILSPKMMRWIWRLSFPMDIAMIFSMDSQWLCPMDGWFFTPALRGGPCTEPHWTSRTRLSGLLRRTETSSDLAQKVWISCGYNMERPFFVSLYCGNMVIWWLNGNEWDMFMWFVGEDAAGRLVDLPGKFCDFS